MTAVTRTHGTRARYVHGPDEDGQPGPCRCTPCRQANTDEANGTYRLKAYGQWLPYVDAEPARRHVEELGRQRIKPKRVAALAGVPPISVYRLLRGNPARGVPPSRRIRAATADAILAVRPSLDLLPDRARVDGTGTRRRLQALVAMGWTLSKLADRAGIGRTNLTLIVRADGVRADTARKVQALYDELWDRPAPAGTARERVAAANACAWAARQGWVPPLAWDDDLIMDPKARPLGVRVDGAA